MFGKIYDSTWWGNPTRSFGGVYYDYAYPISYGAELLTSSDMSSVSWPWNHGSWSFIIPSTDGDIATLLIDGGSYPAANPRIEQTLFDVCSTYSK